MNRSEPIGLLAGAGELPLLFARRARENGFRVFTAALAGSASSRLIALSDEVRWLSVGQLSALLSFFRKRDVRRAVMLGKVQHGTIFERMKIDLKALSVLIRLKDRSGPALLDAIAGEMTKAGVKLIDSRTFLGDALAPKGFLTRRRPDAAARDSAVYGLRRARVFAGLDVGQSLLVKQNAVVAVEAVEGTDEAVRRAGKLAGKGCVLVKVAGPKQDWRFDVPTVGPVTVRALACIGAAGLVLEAGRTFILRREETIALADRSGLFIWAV